MKQPRQKTGLLNFVFQTMIAGNSGINDCFLVTWIGATGTVKKSAPGL
ncbi:hypothetical protein MalM14_56680 [Gimesia chilikensis]|nr:hypothetical protein MalM14_56680 [Gimesia chilikensis]